MASTTFTPLSFSSSSTVIDGKVLRQSAAALPQCVTLPPLSVRCQNRTWKTTAYSPKLPSNVAVMDTEEAPAEVAAGTELPEIGKIIQEAWDKVDDKYAASSLALAGFVALWVSAGMISAIDRLPLVPGVLELVGIGYTGWFSYKNLFFKPDREALIEKIKCTYDEITGGS